MSRRSDARDCPTCAWYLAQGVRSPNGGEYGVPCCLHPRLVNSHGIIATSVARDVGQTCGPEAEFYTTTNQHGERR